MAAEEKQPAEVGWRSFHEQRRATHYPKWPNEAMVKVLFGKYLSNPLNPLADWRVLDVGCGFGNNLVPFLDLGCECHGIEIDGGIVPVTNEILAQRGYSATLGVGTNRGIPYPDNHFDLLLSINTLHYEKDEADILAALREFSRVLKPGAAAYISTVGPDHEIQRRADPMGGRRYRIRNFDFRDGQEFFFLESEGNLSYYCGQFFRETETGRVTEKLMSLPLDFLIAVARK